MKIRFWQNSLLVLLPYRQATCSYGGRFFIVESSHPENAQSSVGISHFAQVDTSAKHRVPAKDELNFDPGVSQGVYDSLSRKPYTIPFDLNYHPVTAFLDPVNTLPHRRNELRLLNELKAYSFHLGFINFRPSTIDGALVLTAFNNLRDGSASGNRFIELLYLHQQQFRKHHTQDTSSQNMNNMIHLRRSSGLCVHQFMLLYQRALRVDGLFSMEIESQNKPKKTRALRTDSFNKVFQQFELGSSSTTSATISRYLDHVLLPFRQEFQNHIANQIEEKLSSSLDPKSQRLNEQQIKRLESGLRKAKQIFPLFLCYVDMISSILPVGTLDDSGELLYNQRLSAARSYYDLVEEALLEKTGPVGDPTSLHSEQQDIINHTARRLTSNEGTAKFAQAHIWHAIQYWGTLSDDGPKFALSTELKAFFNDLVYSVPYCEIPEGPV